MRTLSTWIAMALWVPAGWAMAQDGKPAPPATAERGDTTVRTARDAAPTTLTVPTVETLAETSGTDVAGTDTGPAGAGDASGAGDANGATDIGETDAADTVTEDTEGTEGTEGAEADVEDDTAEPPIDPQVAARLADRITELTQQVADLRKEVTALRDRQGDLTRLRDQIATLEADLQKLRDENRTLSDRLTALAPLAGADGGEGADGAAGDGQQRLLFRGVDARVRFDNHEGREVRMNVNGTWHTLKPGENWIRVPYGPVTVHRYVGAEPRTFDNWTADPTAQGTGAVMAFDVGTPPAQ